MMIMTTPVASPHGRGREAMIIMHFRTTFGPDKPTGTH